MRVAVVLIAFSVAAQLAGCRASAPGRFESTVIWAVKHHVTVGNRKQNNPLPADQQTWKGGQEAFSHYCVACHGMDGRASGVPFADHISPPIPQLDSVDVQSYTDGQLKWILDNGIRPSGMPGSNGTLSDEEQWSIVVFLRHLPPADRDVIPDMYTH